MNVYDKCDGYVNGRIGDYRYRCLRYDTVIDSIHRWVGLESHLTIADIAAGWTEFGHRLSERGFRGRYLPFDGSIDGTDLQFWTPPFTPIEVCVSIEFLEHIPDPAALVETMFRKARKFTIVTTPNSDVVDTLGMDSDHVIALTEDDLRQMGFEHVRAEALFPGSESNPNGDLPDTLIAWRKS